VKGKVKSLKIIRFLWLDHGGDVSDITETNGDNARRIFDLLVAVAPDIKASSSLETVSLADLSKKEHPPMRQFVEGILTEGLCLLCGDPKSGKSLLMLLIA
jgi:hypothetical protein